MLSLLSCWMYWIYWMYWMYWIGRSVELMLFSTQLFVPRKLLTWRVVSCCIRFLHSLHSDPCRCAHRKRASKTRTFALSSEGQPRHRNPCCFRAGSTPGPFLWRAMFHMFHQESGWLMLVENQAPDQENNKLLLTTGFNHLGDVEKWTVEARSNHEPEETKPRMIMDDNGRIPNYTNPTVDGCFGGRLSPEIAGNLG